MLNRLFRKYHYGFSSLSGGGGDGGRRRGGGNDMGYRYKKMTHCYFKACDVCSSSGKHCRVPL